MVLPLSVVAGATWLTHVVVYAWYGRRFQASIKRPWFVALHSVEAAVVFGGGYWFGIKLFDLNIGLSELVIVGLITALLDALAFVFFRDFFRPLLTKANIIFPVITATVGVIIAVTLTA